MSGIPDPGFTFDEHTAIVMTDPQNDFLNPNGAAWPVVGKSVTENNTVENMEALFKVAAETNMLVFISPHYYYPSDKGWQIEGALEKLMHDIHMYERTGILNLEGFEGSGADFLDQFKKYIYQDNVIQCHAHKVFGPETNDLVLQLRKRHINQVLMCGMSANLCVESHTRELLETGFKVAIAKDATAAAIVGEYDGYKAALTNFRMLASHVYTTAEAVEAIKSR
ncbi:isochorismatase family protein [Sediminitomix flava]|uniref:Nicotinamidase-related amidase n=1 Tax=Sediminitomix flava TaxID=379075 RepID=A0A315Z7Q9_SEDFL|nr:isochorismatase family protein [Sediminitomix flava]PWJ38641.1 nicotinamidase-related amidase [Sediminitomix flava]